MEITMKGISKAFGSNEVLKGVDLTLKSGEIHALMGENGAGKSTLMNILTGIHKADSGTICCEPPFNRKNKRHAENENEPVHSDISPLLYSYRFYLLRNKYLALESTHL